MTLSIKNIIFSIFNWFSVKVIHCWVFYAFMSSYTKLYKYFCVFVVTWLFVIPEPDWFPSKGQGSGMTPSFAVLVPSSSSVWSLHTPAPSYPPLRSPPLPHGGFNHPEYSRTFSFNLFSSSEKSLEGVRSCLRLPCARSDLVMFIRMNRSKADAWQAINQASNQGWHSESGTEAGKKRATFLFLNPK